jgi:hypothetical protein
MMSSGGKEDVLVTPSLAQLAEQSKQLVLHPMLIGQELPTIERSVETIETLSRKLVEKTTRHAPSSIVEGVEPKEDAAGILRDADRTRG